MTFSTIVVNIQNKPSYWIMILKPMGRSSKLRLIMASRPIAFTSFYRMFLFSLLFTQYILIHPISSIIEPFTATSWPRARSTVSRLKRNVSVYISESMQQLSSLCRCQYTVCSSGYISGCTCELIQGVAQCSFVGYNWSLTRSGITANLTMEGLFCVNASQILKRQEPTLSLSHKDIKQLPHCILIT